MFLGGLLCFVLLVWCTVDTGVIKYLEKHINKLEYHTWMYFIWITTSTVGYGDISPQTIAGRAAIMYIICFSIVVIPQMTNDLLAKMAKSSVFARAVYTPKVNSRHIIICGDLASTAITELFEELFHPDHQNHNLFAVILYSGTQTIEMKSLLSNTQYELNVHYLEGTVLFDRDLRRAAAEHAEAVLLFTNKFTTTPDRDDAKTILMHHSIKRYIEERKGYSYVNNDVTFCVQLVRPENQRHFEAGGISVECPTEHVICLNEIKMGIVAKSVLFPGTVALIMNMLASFADDDESDASDDEPPTLSSLMPMVSVSPEKLKTRSPGQSPGASRMSSPNRSLPGSAMASPSISPRPVPPRSLGGAPDQANRRAPPASGNRGLSTTTQAALAAAAGAQLPTKPVNSGAGLSPLSRGISRVAMGSSVKDGPRFGGISTQVSSLFQRMNSSVVEKKRMLWGEEYNAGCGWEIYTTDISPAFEGVIFKHLACALYEKLEIVLIGLQIEDLANETNPAYDHMEVRPANRARTILNPSEYELPSSSKFKLRGLVVAKNQTDADLSIVTGKRNMLTKALSKMSMGHSSRSGFGGVSSRGFGGLSSRGFGGLSSRSLSDDGGLRSNNSSARGSGLLGRPRVMPTSLNSGSYGGASENEGDSSMARNAPLKPSQFAYENEEEDAQIAESFLLDKSDMVLNSSGKLSTGKLDESKLTHGDSHHGHKLEDGHDHDHHHHHHRHHHHHHRDHDYDVSFIAEHHKTQEEKKERHRRKLLDRFEDIVKSNCTQQEKEYQLELEFLSVNYYLRPSSQDVLSQADCTISTSVLEEIQHCHNHIIITGSGLGNLYDLIKPLRARELGRLRYIVILTPTDLPSATWTRISVFEGLMIVKGTPLEEEDIRRAGVFRAQQVVVLASAWNASAASKRAKFSGGASNLATMAGLEALLDSDTIFTYKAVKRMNDSAQCVVEFMKDNNISYLNPESGMINSSGDDYKSTPQFAAGELFASSLLDTVVCQSFYNPHIVNIINRFICAKDSSELVVAASQNAKKVGVFKLAPIDQIVGSSLYQIDLPAKLANCRYGVLFKKLTEQGVIPLGLYRAVPGAAMFLNNPGYLNKFPYVYTNPPQDTEVVLNDRVFVLSAKPLHAVKTQTEEVRYILGFS